MVLAVTLLVFSVLALIFTSWMLWIGILYGRSTKHYIKATSLYGVNWDQAEKESSQGDYWRDKAKRTSWFMRRFL